MNRASFIAVAEGVVFDHEVKQIGGFFLDAWIELFTTKCLIDCAQCAFESLVLFQPEQAAESRLHGLDDLHGRLISHGVRCRTSDLLDHQRPVIETIQRRQSIGIIGDDDQKSLGFIQTDRYRMIPPLLEVVGFSVSFAIKCLLGILFQ